MLTKQSAAFKLTRVIFFLFFLSILACSHRIVERADQKGITVYVSADSIIETEKLDMDQLEDYMIIKGKKRASSLLMSRYIIMHSLPLSEYSTLDLSACLKNEKIIDLRDDEDTVHCSIHFETSDCDNIIRTHFQREVIDSRE